jgi:hypothetical protein
MFVSCRIEPTQADERNHVRTYYDAVSHTRFDITDCSSIDSIPVDSEVKFLEFEVLFQ